jgi:hypothetical protein
VPTLHIRHYERSGSGFVDLSFNGSVLLDATHPFSLEPDPFDLEDLRWYHENYFHNWYVSSNAAVERIRRAELKIGKALHSALFDPADGMAQLVRESLAELRIEIRDEVHRTAVPWETITDKETGDRLALRSSSFVRSVARTEPSEHHLIPRETHRLLLVICRPDGKYDVGYWSVAYSLWESLKGMPNIEIDVLRPPTFDSLEKYLIGAKHSGRAYTAVHFDGHGVIANPFGGSKGRGYLVFESTESSNREFIDGVAIGKVLALNDVQHLSMNACRSADSQSADRRLTAVAELSVGQPSIVEEVLVEGVSSCIGMRREIYPGSAARFFSAFYPAFFGGHSAGDAARIARNRLADTPLNANTFDPSITGIEDWGIPVVGERRQIQLRYAQPTNTNVAREELIQNIPTRLSKPSMIGFDQEILALEALFIERKPILIHGPVLLGKSRLALEYAKWYSATTVDSCPVYYIALTPTFDAAFVLEAIGSCIGRNIHNIADCTRELRSLGGVLVLDQADRLSKTASEVLSSLLTGIRTECRIIVTARTPHLDWLPDHRALRPAALLRSKRVALARAWADETGKEFKLNDYYPLIFFSGGLAGILFLLLSSSHELISKGKSSANEIASWLSMSEWQKIAGLSRQAWPNLPSIEELVSSLLADIKAICDPKIIRMLPLLARFHVCFDQESSARLIQMAEGSASPVVPDRRIIDALESIGLIFPVDRLKKPAWYLHPLLKLVVSRLPEGIKRDRLDQLFVETIAAVCVGLVRGYRHDALVVIHNLTFFEQNISDALYIALQINRLDHAATLLTSVGLLNRDLGDIKKMFRVFSYALPYFVDSDGCVRQACRHIAMQIWDLAIWLAPDWPRNRQGLRPPVYLAPFSNDNYGIGLFHRARKEYREAASAFTRELEAPSGLARYEPGDLQAQLSDMIYVPSDPKTWATALKYAQASFKVRHPDDAIGRAASRIAEARIRQVQILNQERYLSREDDLTKRIEILPEDLHQLGQVANLLREAEAEAGGMNAENRSQAAMVWWRVVLARGDLTAAVAYFEQGAELMIEMEEASIWHHYYVFSLQLLRHGWIARSYEAAQNAFQFSMHAGDTIFLPTRLREFCELLKSTYPELEDE